MNSIYDQIPSDVKRMHDLGFKGEGYRFVVLEAPSTTPHAKWVHDIEQAHVPFATGNIVYTGGNMIPKMEECMSYNPHNINMSFQGGSVDSLRSYRDAHNTDNSPTVDRFFNEAFITAASCNNWNNQEDHPAATEYYKDICFSTGSCLKDPSGRYYKAPYVTYNNKLDALTKGDFYIDGDTIQGTSFAAPCAGGRSILYREQLDKLEWYGNEKDRIRQITTCLIGTAVDCLEEGYDIKSGHGVLKMEVLMKHIINFELGKAEYYVDGEERINMGVRTVADKLVEVPVPMQAVNGRTQLSIDVLKKLVKEFAPVLDMQTYWNEEEPNLVKVELLGIK